MQKCCVTVKKMEKNMSQCACVCVCEGDVERFRKERSHISVTQKGSFKSQKASKINFILFVLTGNNNI